MVRDIGKVVTGNTPSKKREQVLGKREVSLGNSYRY